MSDEIREHVVRVLGEIDFTKPLTEAEAEWVYNSTDAEKRAVADMHGRAAERLERRALGDLGYVDAEVLVSTLGRKHRALHAAVETLYRWWVPNRPLNRFTFVDALKIAPGDVRDTALRLLAEGGWSEEEIGLPLPRPERG